LDFILPVNTGKYILWFFLLQPSVVSWRIADYRAFKIITHSAIQLLIIHY